MMAAKPKRIGLVNATVPESAKRRADDLSTMLRTNRYSICAIALNWRRSRQDERKRKENGEIE
jgi:hypothetical protein